MRRVWGPMSIVGYLLPRFGMQICITSSLLLPLMNLPERRLERLERRTPLSVQRDDLTVDYCLVGIQPQACRRDSRIHPGEVLVLPRPKLDSLLVLDDQRPVAVELQLVDPVVALGQRFTTCAAMGVTNAGLVRCGVERLPFGGGPRFFFWLVMGTRRTTDVLPRLLRHLHVELDRRELLGGHAELAQERQPARVRVEVGEHRVGGNRADSGIVVLDRPCPAIRRRGRSRPETPARRRWCRPIVFSYFSISSSSAASDSALPPERVIRHRQPDQAPALDRFLLDFRQAASASPFLSSTSPIIACVADSSRVSAQVGAIRRDSLVQTSGVVVGVGQLRSERLGSPDRGATRYSPSRDRLSSRPSRRADLAAAPMRSGLAGSSASACSRCSRRRREVPVVVHRDPAEAGVRRRVLRVERQRLLGRLARQSDALVGGPQADVHLPTSRHRPGPTHAGAYVRVDRERLLVQRDRLLERRWLCTGEPISRACRNSA